MARDPSDRKEADMEATTGAIGASVEDLDTPALLIDLDAIDRNIQRLQRYLDQHGIANRPHIKTHKLPVIAHAQVAAGAVGITCQKLGEAEVMADAGLTDILITTNIVGLPKLRRLVALARRIHVAVTADDPVIVKGLSAAAHDAGVLIPVLVECDTGQGRCGVQSAEGALELARQIAVLPGLEFGGLMTYPSSPAAADFMHAANLLLSSHGLPPRVVSGGGTPGVWRIHEIHGFTEHRAGEYLFNDRNILASGDAALDDCALRVRSMVTSRPTADRAVLDTGSKTLSSNPGRGIIGFGHVIEYPEAAVVWLTEEHGVVDLSRCDVKPGIGECMTIVPNRASLVVNLHDVAYGVRKATVETIWPILARGKAS
jgi:D-serine deaminase-like pyridoxal phosphate-dependent protein